MAAERELYRSGSRSSGRRPIVPISHTSAYGVCVRATDGSYLPCCAFVHESGASGRLRDHRAGAVSFPAHVFVEDSRQCLLRMCASSECHPTSVIL